MDPDTKILLGFAISVSLILFTQWLIATRSQRKELEDANKQTVMGKIEVMGANIMGELRLLTAGQVSINKELETVKKQIEEANKKLDATEKSLAAAEREIQVKHEDIEDIKAKIENNKKHIDDLLGLYKRMEQWKGLQEVTDLMKK